LLLLFHLEADRLEKLRRALATIEINDFRMTTSALARGAGRGGP
jgi:hypothetical protein